MSNGEYINCPGCQNPVERARRQCPFCGADLAWKLEENRLASEFLRYLAVAVLGGVLLSMVLLLPLGLLTRISGILVPLLAASLILGGVLWLVADKFGASS